MSAITSSGPDPVYIVPIYTYDSTYHGDITYHSMNDPVLDPHEMFSPAVHYESKEGKGYPWWTIHIFHRHPSSAEMMRLFTVAVREKKFPLVEKMIHTLEACSSNIIAGSRKFECKGCGIQDAAAEDDALIKKNANDDTSLKNNFLDLYNKALMELSTEDFEKLPKESETDLIEFGEFVGPFMASQSNCAVATLVPSVNL